MKWYDAIDVPGGRGLRVAFASGESLTIAKGIDERLHVVSSSEGIAYALTAAGGIMLAPKPKTSRRKARNGGA